MTTGEGKYDLDELKRRADLDGEVARLSGTGKKQGSKTVYPCPNPEHADNSPSFTVDRQKQLWTCWSQCHYNGKQAGGDVITLGQWLNGSTYREAIEDLANRYGMTANRSTWVAPRPAAPRVDVVRTVPETLNDRAIPMAAKPAEDVMARYLLSRKWSTELAERVGLTVVVDGYGKVRIRHPFLLDGEPRLWQDRATSWNVKPKWHTPAGATLYPWGIDLLDRYEPPDDWRPGDPVDWWPDCPILGDSPAVWIVEGPADAITLVGAWPEVTVLGVPGAGWWNARHAAALADMPVVVCCDNDDAGDRLRQQIAASLDPSDTVHVTPPALHNDLADWWKAVGPELFRAELTALTNDALDAPLVDQTSSNVNR